MSKAELKNKRKLVGQMTRTEGWSHFKLLMNDYVNGVYSQIMMTDIKERDTLAALSYKLKFGVDALATIIDAAEKMAEELDNEE